MLERLAVVQRHFALAIDLMTPLSGLADALKAMQQIDAVVRLDRLVETRGRSAFAVGDAEALPFGDECANLIVSALGLQTVNDLPGALAQVRRALKPDGLFLAVLVAGDTLTELRQVLAAAEAELHGGAAPRVAPFAGVRELGALLQRAGLALPVADQERITVRYGGLDRLLEDLRATGFGNVLSEGGGRPLTRGIIARASALYAERFADPDGRIRATFDFVWLSGWAPDASQQQALRPGSAKSRLADALGVSELPAGEKADR